MSFEHMKNQLRRQFRIEWIELWHQDSPGVSVIVRRNAWQKLIYPTLFSGVGERTYSKAEMEARRNADKEPFRVAIR